MKNLFLVFILFCSFSAFSQEQEEETKPTDKGSFLINGSLNIKTSNTEYEGNIVEDASQFGFSFSPRAGYFVLNGLALGLETSLSYTRAEFEFIGFDTQISKSTTFTLGPFVRYYFNNGLFVEASVGFGSQNTNTDTGPNEFESETDIFSYELGLGYAIFFNNSVSLEPFLSYQFDRRTQNENDTDTTGLNLGVGFTYYF